MKEGRSRRPLVAAALSILLLVGLAIGSALWNGPLRPGNPSFARFPVRGIDVSHHQGSIAWDAVRRDDVTFAFLKATEGQDHVDTLFAENWKRAGQAGIARGAYHFFTFCSPGALQADHFIARVGALEPELPPVVDVEFAGNCQGWSDIESIRAELRIFLYRVEAAFGRTPLIYLTRRSHRTIVQGHFPGHALWVRDVLFEPSPRAYGPWAFWQFSDDGQVAGIEGPVDLNAYCCSADEFAQLFLRPSEAIASESPLPETEP